MSDGAVDERLCEEQRVAEEIVAEALEPYDFLPEDLRQAMFDLLADALLMDPRAHQLLRAAMPDPVVEQSDDVPVAGSAADRADEPSGGAGAC